MSENSNKPEDAILTSPAKRIEEDAPQAEGTPTSEAAKLRARARTMMGRTMEEAHGLEGELKSTGEKIRQTVRKHEGEDDSVKEILGDAAGLATTKGKDAYGRARKLASRLKAR